MHETSDFIETEAEVRDHSESGFSNTLGTRLQALRKKFGLSQRELARRAEVTNSALSMIEQGKVSPSVGSLEKILRAFPISLQQFFSESLELSPSVTPAREFVHVERGLAKLRLLPLTTGGGASSAFLAEQCFEPGANISSEWLMHNGFVGGMLMEGELALDLEGTNYQLSPGDGFNFSLKRSHSFVNTGDIPCKVVCVAFGN